MNDPLDAAMEEHSAANIAASEELWPDGDVATMPLTDREVINAARRKRIAEFAPFTLFRCGWLTPAGNVQGQMYWRTGNGLAPIGRDDRAEDILRRAVEGGYDRPWAIEVLALPCERRPFEVVAECPGCSTDGSNAMGLQGHLSDCIYNPMRADA